MFSEGADMVGLLELLLQCSHNEGDDLVVASSIKGEPMKEYNCTAFIILREVMLGPRSGGIEALESIAKPLLRPLPPLSVLLVFFPTPILKSIT